MNRICNKCNIEKNIENFRKNKHSRGGYLFTCKICYAAESRLKYQQNIAQERKRSINKYKNNKQYYYSMSVKWRENNLEKSRIIKLQAEHKRRALKLNALIDDFSFEKWLQRKEVFGNKCKYCGIEETKEIKLTQDHVIPLSRGGKHMLANIVPACKSCNSRKGTKTIKEWNDYKNHQ
jgi:5-methylcytosine-specific restriction endonuclease McrA